MYKVVGKAYFSVSFDGKDTEKIRYTLQLIDDDSLRRFDSVEGIVCDSVSLRFNAVNDKPNIGDSVVVSYDVYNGRKFANGIFII